MTEKLKTLSELREELAHDEYEKNKGVRIDEYKDLQRFFSRGFNAGVAEMKKRTLDILAVASLCVNETDVSRGHFLLPQHVRIRFKDALEAYFKSLGDE